MNTRGGSRSKRGHSELAGGTSCEQERALKRARTTQKCSADHRLQTAAIGKRLWPHCQTVWISNVPLGMGRGADRRADGHANGRAANFDMKVARAHMPVSVSLNLPVVCVYGVRIALGMQMPPPT